MVMKNGHRICVLSERLARPFDEGFKNLSLSLIREFSREHKVLGLTTLGEDLPELGVRRVRASKSLLSIALWRCISAFRPRTIYYVPTASYTLFSFMRARVLASYGRGADVEMIALQPRNLGRLSRAIIPRVCPDFLWVQSPQSMSTLAELGCPAGVLPSGVDMDRFHPVSEGERLSLRHRYGLPSDAFIVSHVGHINPNRNVGLLARMRREASCHLILVGSSSTVQDRRLVAQLEDAGVTVFTTYLPRIEEIYQLSDCYVFPVHSDTGCIGMPLSILEAMACNLRVVTTRYGALPSHFDEGGGLLYATDDDSLIEQVCSARELTSSQTRSLVGPLSWEQIARDMLSRVNRCDVDHCADI